MTAVVIAGLCGFGISVALSRVAARVEVWWEPTWAATRHVFRILRSPTTATAVGAAAAIPHGVLAAAAAGTVAGMLAEGAVLLLVRSRT